METLSIDRVLNTEHFYGKFMRKCAPDVIPRALFNFGKYPKTAITYRNSFKKLCLCFLPNLRLGQDYEKPKGPGTSDQLFFTLQNKFRKISLLVMYYLT